MKVTGLDLSLTGTGVAIIEHRWDPSYGREVPRVMTKRIGTPAAGDELAARADRLTEFAGRIVHLAQGSDLVCVERPAYSSNTGSVTDRAGLFWLVCARLIRGHRIPVVDVVNNHLKMYATGAGGGKGATKDAVLAETARRYADLLPHLSSNDEADALNAAALGWHHLTGLPLVELPQTHQRAVTAVKWPTTT